MIINLSAIGFGNICFCVLINFLINFHIRFDVLAWPVCHHLAAVINGFWLVSNGYQVLLFYFEPCYCMTFLLPPHLLFCFGLLAAGLAFVPVRSFWYERIAKRMTKVWNGTNELFIIQKNLERNRTKFSFQFVLIRSFSVLNSKKK